jgi:hypothetical protein
MKKINFSDDDNYIKIPLNRVTIISFFLLILSVTFGSQWFFSKYYLRSPIVLRFQTPIASYGVQAVNAEEIQKVISPLPSPTPTIKPKKQTFNEVNPPDEIKQQIIANSKYPDRIKQIWTNETTQGKPSTDPTALHMYCQSQGMTNEFGFMPKDRHCFKTFQESVDRISLWFDKEAKGLPVSLAMCWYSGHGKVSQCNYDMSLLN